MTSASPSSSSLSSSTATTWVRWSCIGEVEVEAASAPARAFGGGSAFQLNVPCYSLWDTTRLSRRLNLGSEQNVQSVWQTGIPLHLHRTFTAVVHWGQDTVYWDIILLYWVMSILFVHLTFVVSSGSRKCDSPYVGLPAMIFDTGGTRVLRRMMKFTVLASCLQKLRYPFLLWGPYAV